MKLSEIKESIREFLEERDWLKFSPNDVFIHLIEELGEIGKHLLFRTEYKTENQGHNKPDEKELPREFAQAFSLFIQLSILLDIDLEEAWTNEFNFMRSRFPSTDTYK